MADDVTFLASFPPIQSAIKIDGNGGARIQLDVPETEVGNFIRAMMWRGMRLKVTISVLQDETKGHGDKRENKQSKWATTD